MDVENEASKRETTLDSRKLTTSLSLLFRIMPKVSYLNVHSRISWYLSNNGGVNIHIWVI